MRDRGQLNSTPLQVFLFPSQADDEVFWPAETVACVWWRESERGCPEWIDIRGIYILTGVVLPKATRSTPKTSYSPSMRVHAVGASSPIMPMCQRLERIELSSALYLPRRETNTRSRCLAGAGYY